MTTHEIDKWLDKLEASSSKANCVKNSQAIWIFGTGSFAKKVFYALEAAGLKVGGFIVTTASQSEFLDKPIRSLNNAQAMTSLPLVVGVFNRETPYEPLVGQLQKLGFTKIILPWDLYDICPPSFGEHYWLSSKQVYVDNHSAIYSAYAALEDEHSKVLFSRICGFRTGFDIQYSSYRDADTQYFNDLNSVWMAKQAPNWVFVDVGAYDGDSFLQLAEVAPYTRCYLLEPDVRNFALLNQRMAKRENAYPQVICLPIGLADSCRTVTFSGDSGESAHISLDGKQTALVAPLDAIFANERVDFIKMDVEGAEMSALQGAVQSLKKYRPALAISLYHKPGDLWVLINWLQDLDLGYTLHIRQHFFNSFDSVLYALPPVS